MRVHFAGVHGSTPAPGPDFDRYGGHTSCLALTAGRAATGGVPTLLLDSGTGIRTVSALLGGAAFVGTIALTHLHWDHVQGLPFFAAGDHPGARVTLLVPPQADDSPAIDVLGRAMSPPHFPITPDQLRGQWTFATTTVGGPPWEPPGPGGAQPFSVVAREIPHKGGTTLGYRVSDGHSTLAYLPDHCPTSFGPGPDGWGEYHPAALDLARSADLVVHDAHLLPEELAEQAVFGHAAADYALGLAAAAGARQVALFHHAPGRTDAQLDALGRRLAGGRLPVTVATQGTSVDL